MSTTPGEALKTLETAFIRGWKIQDFKSIVSSLDLTAVSDHTGLSIPGWTSLMITCCYSETPEVLNLIFEKIDAGGPDLLKSQLTAKNPSGDTCLMIACGWRGSAEVLKLLFEKIDEAGGEELLKSLLTATNNDGETCLMDSTNGGCAAMKVVSEKIFKVGGAALLKSQLTATTKKGWSCLKIICHNNASVQTMKLLATLMFGFHLWEWKYWRALDGADQLQLRKKAGIEIRTWTPDIALLSEMKSVLLPDVPASALSRPALEHKLPNLLAYFPESIAGLSDDFRRVLQTLQAENDRKTAPLRSICTKHNMPLPESVIQKLISEDVIENHEFEVLDNARLDEMNIGRDDRLKVLKLANVYKNEAFVEMRTRYSEMQRCYSELAVQNQEMQRRLNLNNELGSLQQEKVSLIMKLPDSQEKNKWLDSMNYSMNMNNASLDELQQAIDDLVNENADLARSVGVQRSASSHQQRHFFNAAPPAAYDGGDDQSTAQDITSSEQRSIDAFIAARVARSEKTVSETFS